ncbi:hypothetical protein GFY24_00840 [Nocardia sp. SYP-A9097]|nr:hypothetical protein [Nocardia sp. SYP-A9097]
MSDIALPAPDGHRGNGEPSADEFERAYAARSGITVAALRAHGRIVRPCECGDVLCEGWQSVRAEP